MQQRLPSLLADPIGFAHRGARAYAPENTLEAFTLGLKLGANGLESDVWLTADGVPVLDHDGVVRKRLGRKIPIGALRRDQLPSHVPALTDLIERCGAAYHLSLDLKDDTAGRRVIDVVREAAPALLPRLWLCHPRYEALFPLRGLGARLVDSTRLEKIKEGPERRAATLAKEGIDGINLFHTDWNGGLITLFHRFDRTTFAWGIQDRLTLERAFWMGIDAVYSDHPDRMMDAYKATLGTPTPIED